MPIVGICVAEACPAGAARFTWASVYVYISVLPYEGGCLTLMSIERLPVMQPLLAHLLFCLALIIDWRNQGHSMLDLHQHNVLDGTGGPTLAVESHCLLKERSFLIHRRRAFEAIALASHGIDHVDLYDRLQLHIGDGSRRADIGEDEVVIVPDGRGPFRRQIGRAVWADRGHKAKPLLGDDAFHILRQADGCFPVHPSPFLPNRRTLLPSMPACSPFCMLTREHTRNRAFCKGPFGARMKEPLVSGWSLVIMAPVVRHPEYRRG